MSPDDFLRLAVANPTDEALVAAIERRKPVAEGE
jgi:hypothetical protein